MKIEFTPIGYIKSPFKENFTIPRQSGIMQKITSKVVLNREFASPGICKELEKFDHIWLIAFFHQLKSSWSPTVRPPRLGGNRTVGLYASRSPYRPNPISLSVVKLQQIEESKGEIVLTVSGADLLDGTPILDIKPYISYSDSIPTSSIGWLDQAITPSKLTVTIEPHVIELINQSVDIEILKEILSHDPRPTYYTTNPREHQKKTFAAKIFDFDFHWIVDDKNQVITVTDAKPFQKEKI